MSLMKGKENDWYWFVNTVIDEEGNLRERYALKFFKSPKAKIIKLIGGKEDNFNWYIQCVVNDSGTLRNRGRISISSYEDVAVWRSTHREKHNKLNRKYMVNHKEYYAKHTARRKRELGFNPLNTPIEGIECDAHHINKEDVIYIPTIIHRRVNHSIKNNKNMKVINSIAYSFL